MLIEEATVPSTHVPVAEHPTFAHPNGTEVLQTVHVTIFVYPFRR
jgi:hypothetical protein